MFSSHFLIRLKRCPFIQVTILLKVHHRNLTNLVGYLNEGTHLGLIYEYMANGSLAQRLSGNVFF